MTAPVVRLKPGREKSVLERHPWIYSGALAEEPAGMESGGTLRVVNNRGEFLAWAAYSPASKIRARVWSWNEDDVIDAEFFRRRIRDAVGEREGWIQRGVNDSCRLVYAESDGIPGLIVDRYAGWLVMQSLTAGSEAWKDTLAEILAGETGIDSIYERSDVEVRSLEGLPEKVGLLRGSEPPETVEICENGLKFLVDLRRGQKTGFFLDQRLNRQHLRDNCAGRDVLNCFCYTGGFSVYALAGGARSVLSVDASAEALALGERILAQNRLIEREHSWMEGDVFRLLRLFRDQARSFDLIVLDPPKFAPTAAQASQAARGYKDINLLAFKLLRPGGLLYTFSCSGGISADLFQKIVAGAALDAGADASIIASLRQAPDHPVALNFPESAYLKGLVVRKR